MFSDRRRSSYLIENTARLANCQFPRRNRTFPDWNTLFPNATDTLRNLLNSTRGQKALMQVYKAMTKVDWLTVMEKRFSQSLASADLGGCGRDIRKIQNDSKTMFAYFDAAGKPHSGIMQGNLMWTGSVDACEKIADSHFCVSLLTLLIPSRNLVIPEIGWSACFPASCDERAVSKIMTILGNQVSSLTNKEVSLKPKRSQCEKERVYPASTICTLVFCGFLLLLCFIGTILDLVIELYDSNGASDPPVSAPGMTNGTFNNIELTISAPQEMPANDGAQGKTGGLRKSHSTLSTAPLTPDAPAQRWEKPEILNSLCCEIFLCFSLVRNTKKIFNTNVPSTAITSINGIRVITMSWVLLGHTFLLVMMSPFSENKARIRTDAGLFTVMPLINGMYSVDSFFFLSGLLVAYTCFRKMQKTNGQFNWVLFYVHRFWRLTPSYMFVILFHVYLRGLLSEELLWGTQDKDPLCTKYWWTNLLYINNFYPEEFEQQCIAWSWYLANDMQFFVISPLLLFLAFKYGWRGVAATAGSLLVISSVVIASLYGYYDLDPVGGLKLYHDQSAELIRKQNQYLNYIYGKPYCRIQPYLVGFILGYFIYRKYSGPKRRTGWIVALIGWSVAAAVAMTLVYGPRDTTLPGGEEWTKGGKVVFGMLERFLWGLVLAWVTYACHYGYGGLVQQFLSARFWIPLSRLSYSVYLIHLMVLTFMGYAARGTMYYTIITATYYYLAALILSFAAGYILSVVIEFPCENLEVLALKVIRSRGSKKKYDVSS